MAGFSNGLFSIGASGNIQGQSYNVVYTPSGSGVYTPTIIPSTTQGGGTTVVQSSISQIVVWLGVALLVLLVVLVAKR